MVKAKEPEITVSTVFAGTQTDRQAFMDLIVYKTGMSKSLVDRNGPIVYNKATPNCGIHGRTEAINED